MRCGNRSCSAKASAKCGNGCDVRYCSQECADTHWDQEHEQQCIGVKITVDGVEIDLPTDIVLEIASKNETIDEAIEFLTPYLNSKEFSDGLKDGPRMKKFYQQWPQNVYSSNSFCSLLLMCKWDAKEKRDILSYVFDQEVDADDLLIRNREGYTFEIAKLAIELGATPTQEMLHEAVKYLRRAYVVLFLDTNLVEIDDECLKLATKKQDYFMIELFLQKGVNPNRILPFCIARRDAVNVQQLIRAGAIIDTSDLFRAIDAGDQKIFDLVFSAGQEFQLDAALLRAVDRQSLHFVSALLKAGAKISKETLLSAKRSQVLKALLDKLNLSREMFDLLRARKVSPEYSAVLDQYEKTHTFRKPPPPKRSFFSFGKK